MSEPINQSQFDAKSFNSAENIGNMLPDACKIEGYWDSLAKNSFDWAHEISASPMWRDANENLIKWKKEYRRSKGLLIKENNFPNFVGKSSGRIKEKVFSKLKKSDDITKDILVLFGQEAPIPKIEDLVRVRIETKFLDGVPFLAKKIFEFAKINAQDAKLEAKGKLSGYFAQHITFQLPAHFRFAGQTIACNVTCEVQVATTLGTLVWENSHGLYENTRNLEESAEDWQWSPNDPRFLARQLGHMIHLADGLFCNLRDQGKNGKH